MTLEIRNKTSCKIRVLASFIDSLVAVCPAVQYGILHTKSLEKFLALIASEDNFEARMSLPSSYGRQKSSQIRNNGIILDPAISN